METKKPDTLSNPELLSIIKVLVKKEKQQTLSVISHLEEIQRRRLFASLGYSSMLDYAKSELGYSEAEACIRLSAMRLAKDVPLAKEELLKGNISLTLISQTASSIRRQEQLEEKTMSSEEKSKIIQEVSGKSTREAELILKQMEQKKAAESGGHPIPPKPVLTKISVSAPVVQKLLKLKEIKGNFTDSELIELLLDQELNRQTETPVKTVTAPDTTTSSGPEVNGTKDHQVISSSTSGKTISRYIPQKVKQEVWARAGGRCEFVDKKSGRRCNQVHHLEYDHGYPFAWGGNSDSAENITLKCKCHNQLAAINCFGFNKMDPYINGKGSGPLRFK